MIDTSALQPAFSALDDCDTALAKLEKLCCDPDRSPRMRQLAETLADARAAIGQVAVPGADGSEVSIQLENAGSLLGSLQVGCCAPNRMPLYALMLERLTAAQLAVHLARGTGH